MMLGVPLLVACVPGMLVILGGLGNYIYLYLLGFYQAY